MSLQLPGRRLRDGRPVLAIPVGPGRNEILLARLQGLRTSPGFRVGRGRRERALSGGVLPGRGPPVPLRPLGAGRHPGGGPRSRAGGPAPTCAGWPRPWRRSGDRRPEELATDAVRFLEDGAVELLSPQVMRQAREHPAGGAPPAHLRGPQPPGLPRPLSYCLAAMLYRLIAGEYPFAAESIEETRRRARELRLAPLSLTPAGGARGGERGRDGRPGARHREAPPTLERWAALLAGLGSRRAVPRAARGGSPGAGRQGPAREQELASRAYRRGVFWQRHWKTVLIVAAIAAAVGIFSGTVLRNLLKLHAPPVGLSPREVVESFYRSANSPGPRAHAGLRRRPRRQAADRPGDPRLRDEPGEPGLRGTLPDPQRRGVGPRRPAGGDAPRLGIRHHRPGHPAAGGARPSPPSRWTTGSGSRTPTRAPPRGKHGSGCSCGSRAEPGSSTASRGERTRATDHQRDPGQRHRPRFKCPAGRDAGG